MENLNERSIEIVIKNNSYTINYPTVGQFIGIESKKAQLAKGQYGNMIDQNTLIAYKALNMIDSIAHLEILIPNLVGDLKVISLLSLDAIDALELEKVYIEQILPWLKSWQSLFLNIREEIKIKNEEIIKTELTSPTIKTE